LYNYLSHQAVLFQSFMYWWSKEGWWCLSFCICSV